MRKGQKQSEESKAKISQSKKGIKKTKAEKEEYNKLVEGSVQMKLEL